ncbi:MAG: serine hydrolase domain-containing protein [Planctomycetota bacterium]
MDKVDATAAVLAVSRDGKLLVTRGYGFRDRGKIAPTPTDALFRVASITKPFTAAAVRELVRQKKLALDVHALETIDPAIVPHKLGDERARQITIAQLLTHRAGWDRAATFDPVFKPRDVGRALQIDRDVTPRDLLTWMLGKELQFTPGEREAYSNLGYCMLGRVLEARTGRRTYFEALQDLVLRPAGLDDVRLAATDRRDRREVWYSFTESAPRMEVLDACAGLVASAPALCRFMDRFWLSGEPRAAGQRQQWYFFGSLSGTMAMARQHIDGWNVAVLLNRRRDHDHDADEKALQAAVDAALEARSKK